MSIPTAQVELRIDGYRRLDAGRRIRAAMQNRKLTIVELAERTREVDPSGVGVNWRQVGFLVSQGTSSRNTCTVRVAELVAEALDVPVTLLFEARTTYVVHVLRNSAQGRIEVETA